MSCLPELFLSLARSYGAPGVEFMGLHRENNAVVQIHFLPGQVRGLPHLLSLTSPRRGVQRQAFGGPGFGSERRAGDHLPSPSFRFMGHPKSNQGSFHSGALNQPARGGPSRGERPR